MFRFSRLSKAASSVKPTLTLHHNTQSSLSRHLLEKLTKPTAKYTLDVLNDKLPLYSTYHFIHEECIHVHPQNARGFEQIFPALLRSSDHTFCDHSVKKQSKQKQFVSDLDLVSKEDYMQKVVGAEKASLVPFVVDWTNKLVAVDDEGLDKIMANYSSCGLQSSSHVYKPEEAELISEQKQWQSPSSLNPKLQAGPGAVPQAHAAAVIYAVHPHAAEFADLF